MKSLYSKIVIVVASIVIGSAFFSFLFSNLYYQGHIKDMNEKKILSIAHDIVQFYEENPTLPVDSYLTSVAKLQYQLYLFDERNDVKTFGTPFKHDEIEQEVIQYVQKGNVYNGIQRYHSSPFVTGFFKDDIQNSIGVPITVNGKMYALFVRPNIKQQFGELHFLFAFMLGFAFLGSIVAILFASRRIVTPIKVLAKATEEVGKGNFAVRLQTKRRDEIGTLFTSFGKMTRSLQALEQMRQEFVSNVSHEMKSPLTTIKGFARALQKVKDEEQREMYCTIISNEATRMSVLSEQLLTLASLDAEAKIATMQQYGLHKQLTEIILSLEPLWSEKNVQLHIDMPATNIQADPLLVHQVWVNIIENAIKFSEENGSLYITIEHKDDVCVVVRDTGIGMTEQQQQRIFERFYKGDESRNRQISGSGLGLAIVKKIIDLHNGKISVYSKLGVGTTVTVSLPNTEIDDSI